MIKISIIEDQLEIRESLRILIDGAEGFRCAGTFRSMEEALAGIGLDLPDIALVDIGLPGMSGIAGIKELKKRYSRIVPLMLTVYDDDDRIFDALCAGACGYLLKKTPPQKLLESLNEAVSGGAPMSPEGGEAGDSPFSESPPSGARRLPIDAARIAAAEDAGGRREL